MKTLLDLIIRLAELQNYEGQPRNFTQREQSALKCLASLVRESLPSEVLLQYQKTLVTEPELIRNPDVFGMAVLVAAYKGLSEPGRKRLASVFDTPPTPRLRNYRTRTDRTRSFDEGDQRSFSE